MYNYYLFYYIYYGKLISVYYCMFLLNFRKVTKYICKLLQWHKISNSDENQVYHSPQCPSFILSNFEPQQLVIIL